MSETLGTLQFRLNLFYDFNSPPDQDGLYHCVITEGLRPPDVGDEVIFGIGADETLTRGVVRRVVQIVYVERKSKIGAESFR